MAVVQRRAFDCMVRDVQLLDDLRTVVAMVGVRKCYALNMLAKTKPERLENTGSCGEFYDICPNIVSKNNTLDIVPKKNKTIVLSTGRMDIVLDGHSKRTVAMALSDDNKMLVSCSDREVRLWDIFGRVCVRSHQRSPMTFFAVAISAEGTYIAGEGNGAVQVWHVNSNVKPTVLQRTKASIRRVAISAPGTTIVTSDTIYMVTVWRRLTTWTCVKTLEATGVNGPSIALSMSGDTLIAAGPYYKALFITDTFTDAKPIAVRLTHRVESLAVSRSARMIIIGSNDGTITMRRIPCTAEELAEIFKKTPLPHLPLEIWYMIAKAANAY